MTRTGDKMIRRLVLGRYRIVQLLAQGGMGAVYLARVEGAAGFAKPVVVKCILSHLSDSAEDRTQFIREAQILSNLQHPGIVNVIDFGKAEGAYLMVLEYVHGYHLGQWLKYVIQKGRQLPWQSCIHIMLNVLAALQYAHTFTRSDGTRAAVVHHDISPGNILIDVDGNIRLADFGIARMQGDQTSRQGSVDTIFRGKLSYAAPELLSTEDASPSTDIYACGVVLYQLLTGSNPFSAEDAAEVIHRVIAVVPPPISRSRSDTPRGLDNVVAKAMAKDANGRYTSARDFAAALRVLLVRAEAEIAAETKAMIRTDFTGDLADTLSLQSLEELDDAWRTTIGYSMVPERSSMPPTVQLPKLGRRSPSGEPTMAAAALTQAVALTHESSERSAGHSSRRLVVTVLAAGLLAAGVAAAVSLSMRSRTPATEPRYLVVESSADTHEARNAVPTPTNSASVDAESPAPPASSAGTSNKAVRADSKPHDALNALSKTFARRQSAIQNCFQSNAPAAGGSPDVSVRFSVDVQGKVLSAAVRPDSVAATPLGGCLQQLARSTDFGPQEKPVTFSIPITARVR
jgi:eukaryotic-like serine/threonine-protein kinase